MLNVQETSEVRLTNGQPQVKRLHCPRCHSGYARGVKRLHQRCNSFTHLTGHSSWDVYYDKGCRGRLEWETNEAVESVAKRRLKRAV